MAILHSKESGHGTRSSIGSSSEEYIENAARGRAVFKAFRKPAGYDNQPAKSPFITLMMISCFSGVSSSNSSIYSFVRPSLVSAVGVTLLSMLTSYPISQASETPSARPRIVSLSCPGRVFPETYWLKSFLLRLKERKSFSLLRKFSLSL